MPNPQAKAEVSSQRYQTLLEVGEVIHACRDLEELFRQLAECLRRLLSFDAIAIGLVEPETQMLRVAMMESWVKASVDVGFTVALNAVPAGLVIEQQRAQRVRTADNDPRFPLHNEGMRRAGFAVSYHLPLTTSLTRLGELIFTFKEEVDLPDSEIEFMQRIANLVAVAIENAGNFDQARCAQAALERRNRRRELLLELTNSMVSRLELQDVLEAVARSVRKVVPCSVAVVSLPDDEGENLIVKAVDFPESKGLIVKGLVVPIKGSMTGSVFESGVPRAVNQVDASYYSAEIYRRVEGEGLRCQCFVPFVSRGRSLGVLGLARREQEDFRPDEVEFLKHVAAQVAVAVENAMQFEQLRIAEREVARERDRSGLLLEVNNAVVSHLDLHGLVKSISASLRPVVHHDAAGLTILDEQGSSLRILGLDQAFPEDPMFKEGDLILLEGTPEGEAIATRRTVLISPVIDLNKYTSPVVRGGYERGIRSGCAVPLISHGRVLGVLSVLSLREAALTENDAKLLEQCSGQIAIAVENAMAYREIAELKDRLAQEKLYLEDEIRSEINFDEIIGESAALHAVLNQVQTVAPSDSTVLILGETGTGKELIARAIHEASRRKGGTFVKLNCAAIPTGLLESELFGHERGAFTGAIAQKIGRMELANGGTLFLDEVGDIPLELQPKLLRALQEREFERLGSVRTQKADVRFLAATNCDLPKMVADKQFRSDLFYRLNVFPIKIPALRERREDFPRLVRYFVSKFSKKIDKKIETIPTAVMNKLQLWHWPGNVRELENFIERSVILTSGSVLFVPLAELEALPAPEAQPVNLRDNEREHILQVLRDAKGVLAGPTGAAARLGVKRTTLQSKMKKLGITRDAL